MLEIVTIHRRGEEEEERIFESSLLLIAFPQNSRACLAVENDKNGGFFKK
jgi:hypothetical protein